MKAKHCLALPTNFLLQLKQTFPPIIWIFTDGDGIEFRLPFKIFSTLTVRHLWSSPHWSLLWKLKKYRIKSRIIERISTQCVGPTYGTRRKIVASSSLEIGLMPKEPLWLSFLLPILPILGIHFMSSKYFIIVSPSLFQSWYTFTFDILKYLEEKLLKWYILFHYLHSCN